MANLLHFNRHMYNTQAKIHLKWDMSENTQLLANEIQRKLVLARSPSPTHVPAATAPSSPPMGGIVAFSLGVLKFLLKQRNLLILGPITLSTSIDRFVESEPEQVISTPALSLNVFCKVYTAENNGTEVRRSAP